MYHRVPHITLKSIANNTEIDVIWERWQQTLEPLRAELNGAFGHAWEEWEIPREAGEPWPEPATAAWRWLQSAESDAQKADALLALNNALRRDYTLEDVPAQPSDPWDAGPTDLHGRWWEARIARQKELDASIAAKADFEYLYDRPYEDRGIVRVAGPFTVESLAPHRTLGVDEDDELIDHLADTKTGYHGKQDFATMILEHLNTSGVQQAHREDRISFTALTPWPGDLICAEGSYDEGDADTGTERRAGIFIGPEFGTVSRPDLVAAAREAADADFDVLIACAFSYEAHATEFSKLGRIPILKARMNADLHMAGDLKNTGKGNLFVIFGEPDIEIIPVQDNGTGARQIPGQGQRRRRVPPQHRRNPQRRPRRHRLLVRRHRLQRGELLRPPRLLPRRQRPLQSAKDHPQDRDPPRRLGDPAQRHLPPLRPPYHRPHRSQSNQPPRRRSNEGLQRVTTGTSSHSAGPRSRPASLFRPARIPEAFRPESLEPASVRSVLNSGTNRAAQALRWATQSLYRSPSALAQHFRRMRACLGTPQATTATAHKLARIIYHLITHSRGLR